MKNLIEEFNIEYSDALDSGCIELWPEFFTDNAVYRITSRENFDLGLTGGILYAQGIGMLRDRAKALAETQYFAPRYLMHMNTNVKVLEGLQARSNFILIETLVEEPSGLHLAGQYYDQFELVDSKLKLKSRTVVYDTNLINSAVIYPV
jgi:3-phenylpropionate/cinnamic acid dioxygenase small subunit